MITIRTAAPEELPQLRDLWRKCFGDPGAYVDIFFQKFCSIDQVLVVDDDGEVGSMAAMLPGAIQLPDGTEVPVGYVYALATNPYMQGKGHARQLLRYADDFLQKRGDKAMVLVPASPSLHRFFEAVGMDECFATRKVEILTSALSGDTGGGVMTPVSPREYNEIREGYLKNTFHMTYTDQMISFQQIGSHLARLCIVAGATARSRGAVVLAVGFGGLLAGDTRRAGRGCIGLGQRRDQSGHRIIRR